MAEFKSGGFYQCPHLGALVICTDPQADNDVFSGVLLKDNHNPITKKAGQYSTDWLKFAFIETEISITEV